MKLQVGDRVRFLDEEGEAVVKEVMTPNEVMIEDETGFEYPYPSHKLIYIPQDANEEAAYGTKEPEIGEVIARNIDQKQVDHANKDFKLKYKKEGSTNMRRKGEHMEVDLHIHELVDNPSGLENADIVDIQMRHFERMMGIAEQGTIRRVIFIHGVGQGVLRQEIRKALEMYYPNTTYHDASFQEYGYGATEVIINQN